MQAILAESHSIPKFHGELLFRSGNAAVADRAPGLAEMTAAVVRTGTQHRASRQIEEDLRSIGADLSSQAGSDISSISFSGLSEFAEPLLVLVQELAREASFPEAEFERERRQKLEEVKLNRTQPSFLANERLRKVLFGAHPYAHIAPNEAQVAAYRREDLQSVYREYYTPRSSVNALRQHGYFSVSAAVRNDVVAASLTEMFYELDKLRSLSIPSSELADAQNYLSGVFSLGLATQDALLTQFSTVAQHELPDDYVETYRAKVRAVASEQVLEMARKYLDSVNMQVVLAGDRAQIESQAALFGDLEIFDAQGNALG